MKKRSFLAPVTVLAASLAGNVLAALPESVRPHDLISEATQEAVDNVSANNQENPFILMRPNSIGDTNIATHYSHRSHSSHASHRSHYSGY